MSALRALISIGTNSTRLLILEGDRVASAQSLGTRLGRGLDEHGRLDRAAAELTLNTIRSYAAEVRHSGASIDAIATSALRRASDADAFVAAVQSIAGIAPRILSGSEEATYSFLGATWCMASSGRVGVLDVGGGSTELAVGTSLAVEQTISLEIGAVRISERFPALLGEGALDSVARVELVGRVRAELRSILAPLAGFERFHELIAVGGTVFTVAAMIAGDPARDGVMLDRVGRRRAIDELLGRDLAARRTLAHIRPQRADILPGGLLVVDVACEHLRVDALRVSHADLLAGYLRSPQYRAAALPAPAAAKEDRAAPRSNIRLHGMMVELADTADLE